jgi:hypothetical protein
MYTKDFPELFSVLILNRSMLSWEMKYAILNTFQHLHTATDNSIQQCLWDVALCGKQMCDPTCCPEESWILWSSTSTPRAASLRKLAQGCDLSNWVRKPTKAQVPGCCEGGGSYTVGESLHWEVGRQGDVLHSERSQSKMERFPLNLLRNFRKANHLLYF